MRTAVIFFAIAISCVSPAGAQTVAGRSAASYLSSVGLPFPATEFRKALLNVFDKAGHERRVLAGEEQINGTSTPIVFTRELDGKFRIDFGGSTPRRAVVNSQTGEVHFAASETGGQDYELMESLGADSAEGFVYGFNAGGWTRWLGGSFRPAGSGPDYNGPYYDIYQQTIRDPLGVEKSMVTKRFFFDSGTRLLAKTRYKLVRGGTPVEIETSFSGWTQMGDQIVPTRIVRTEGGQPVFSISIQSAVSEVSGSDSFFSLEQ